MARLAGLRLAERWGGWNREPFTSESQNHIVTSRHVVCELVVDERGVVM
jgi:hypothetical protein